MFWKLYIEDGDYLEILTGEPRNLQGCEIAYTPEGINAGWEEFETEEEAMAFFNIERKEEI